MTAPIRIGAVNYLNTKPLIYDLLELAPDAELILDVPSRLADLLARGTLDVALIPVIEYFRTGSYTIVPNIAIASRGPVLSVTLFSRMPWTGIRRVALDAGSRTSAALDADSARASATASRRRLCRCRWTQHAEDVDADAVLLIGDRAMRACLPGFAHALRPGPGMVRLDRPAVRLRGLGGARRERTSAAWRAALVEAKRRGLARSRPHRPRTRRRGWDSTPASAAATLPTSFTLTWGRANRPGLHHYYMLACELGLARRGVNLEFYRSTTSCAKPLTASG